MNQYYVLTAIGPDRTGLVDEITSYLSEREINIEDSRMAVLGGEFAIILLASGSGSSFDSLLKVIKEIEQKTGLVLHLKSTISPDERKVQPSIPHKLHVTSLDHPGLVNEITALLRRFSINIESMDTRVAHAPVSGTPVFTMHCSITIPVSEKISTIKQELQNLENKLNVDIDLVAPG